MKTKYIPAILWALCILIATNNYNFQSLLFNQDIAFNFRFFPDPLDLFILNDIHLDSRTYVFQKIGHAISFGVLFLLLSRSTADNRKAFILCGAFAFFTEFVQLFFERSGRLSDVIIDMGVIYLAYHMSKYLQSHGGLNLGFRKTAGKK